MPPLSLLLKPASASAACAAPIVSMWTKRQEALNRQLRHDAGGDGPGGNAYSLSPAQYGDFLKALFDLWYRELERGKILFYPLF